MSGGRVKDALQEHFEAVCRGELDRLRRKLVGLSDAERACAETVVADVIGALARTSVERLDDGNPPHPAAIDALVHLFALEAPHQAA